MTQEDASSVDAYLRGLPDDARLALERLREAIRAVVPDATEVISYQIPTLKYEGRMLLSYAAFKDHCSIFPASDGVLKAGGDALRPRLAGKATIRFTTQKPLSKALIAKIAKARLAEVCAEIAARKQKLRQA